MPNVIFKLSDSKVVALILRLLSIVAGFFAAALAIVLPLLFISSELQEASVAIQEAKSAGQWVATPIVLGAFAVALAFGFAVLAGFVAYRLFRFSVIKPKPKLGHF